MCENIDLDCLVRTFAEPRFTEWLQSVREMEQKKFDALVVWRDDLLASYIAHLTKDLNEQREYFMELLDDGRYYFGDNNESIDADVVKQVFKIWAFQSFVCYSDRNRIDELKVDAFFNAFQEFSISVLKCDLVCEDDDLADIKALFNSAIFSCWYFGFIKDEYNPPEHEDYSDGDALFNDFVKSSHQIGLETSDAIAAQKEREDDY